MLFRSPLIRYDIGDFAEAGEPCPCGRGLPVVKHIAGRVRNMVTLPDGRQQWASFPSSKWRTVAPVSQLQLIQTSATEILVRIVPERRLTGSEREELITILRECLGHPFRMKIEEVAEIPRGFSGKFEEFVSELPAS